TPASPARLASSTRRSPTHASSSRPPLSTTSTAPSGASSIASRITSTLPRCVTGCAGPANTRPASSGTRRAGPWCTVRPMRSEASAMAAVGTEFMPAILQPVALLRYAGSGQIPHASGQRGGHQQNGSMQGLTVVVAPDSFKGSLPAALVAHAIADGWSSVRPQDTLRLIPQADGGEGTLDAIEGAVPG